MCRNHGVTLTLVFVVFGIYLSAAAVPGSVRGAERQSAAEVLPSQAVHLKAPPAPTALPKANVPAVKALSLPRRFNTDARQISDELRDLVKAALRDNPDLAAARAALTSSLARVPQAGMPEDPKVGFRLKDMPTTFSFSRENATERQAVVMQTYPFPGKLTLRQKVAGAQAEVIREELHRATLHLVAQVRSAFAGVFTIDKDIELALDERRVLREFVEIATAKYKVGPGLQQDILNADVALSRLDSFLIELTRKRMTREIQLAVLLNRERISIEPLGALPLAKLEHTALELEQMAVEMNPEITMRQRAVERDQLQLALARRAVLPDLFLELDYGSRSDPVASELGKPRAWRPDMVGGVVGVSVPVFYYYKQRQQVIEAEAALARSRERLQAVRRTTVGSLHDQLVRLSQYEQVASALREDVIPLAQTAVAASMSAYQVGKVDFLTMLNAQETLEKYETEYWHNEAERYRTLARIDELTGGWPVDEGWSR